MSGPTRWSTFLNMRDRCKPRCARHSAGPTRKTTRFQRSARVARPRVVLSAALYPYVYILARAAFREQSGASYDVARALGAGPFARFWRVGFPLARPAIAAGVAVVMMETVNDFGTVDYFRGANADHGDFFGLAARG